MALGKRAKGILDVLFQPEEFDDRFEVREIPKVKPRDVYGRPVVDELKPIDAPNLTLSDLEGYPYLSTMSDRTAASGLLTGIGDKELAYPIPLTGGQDFMFRNRELWASDSAPVDKMVAAGRELKKTYGRDPLFIPWRMTPTGSDFASEMTAGAMMSYASRNMPAAEKRRLNREIGALVPDFVGVDSPYAPTQMQLQPDPIRKRIQEQIMDTEFRESGGISLPQARLAVADQDQLNAPVLGFKNVGLFDVDAGNLRGRGNTTYPDAIAGEPLGRLETDATLLDLEPTNVYPARSKNSAFGRSILMDKEGRLRDPSTAKGFNKARRSAELNPFGGIIDEPLLRSLESKGIKVSASPVSTIIGLGLAASGLLGSEEASASPLVNVAKASKDISKGTQRSNTVGTAKKATAYLDEIGAKGRSLDYGAGLGLNAKATGIKDTFEPFPQKGFNPTFTDPNSVPKSKYGRIINTNVINVIEPETVIDGEVRRLRDEVVTNIGQALKPNGVAVIQTWNPQAFKAGYKPETHELGSEPMSYITPDGQYQKAFTKDELKDYVSSVLGDGYEVTNVPNKVGLSGVGVAVKKIRQPATLKMAPVVGAGILAGAQSEDTEASFVGVMSKAGAGRNDLLVMAKRMEDEGLDPEDIWRFTGWEKNEADGEWRTELPNQPSSIKLPMTRKARAQKSGGRLGDFIKDEQLLSQYSGIQDLRNLPVYFSDDIKGGRYSPRDDAIFLPLKPNKRDPGVFIHELQHAIQRREVFAPGGGVQNIKYARGDSLLLDSYKADRNNLLADIEKKGPENTSVVDMEELQNLNEAIDRAENFRKAEDPFKANPSLPSLESQDFAMYQNIVGEVEANNVMYRMQYLGRPSVDDESVLRGMSPRSTEDMTGIAPVERNLQIILDDDRLGITPVQSDYMDNYTAKISKGMKEYAEEKKKSSAAAQSAAAVGLLGLPMTGSAAEAEAGKMLLGGVEDALRMVVGGITGLVGANEQAEDILDSKLINPSPEFAEAQAAMLQPVFEDYVVPMVNAALDAKNPIGKSSRDFLQNIAEMYNKLPDYIKEKLGYGAMTAFGILSLSPFGMGRAKDAPVDLELPLELPKEQPKGLLPAM